MKDPHNSNLIFSEEPIVTPEQITSRLKKSKGFLFSKYVILGFFPSLYSYIKKNFSGITTGYINKLFPYYSFEFDNQLVTFQFPGIGAPLTGALLEESISLGGEIFIFLGRAGLLKDSIPRDSLIIPSSALKDEGTSRHYVRTGTYSYPNKQLVALLQETVKNNKYEVEKGRVWTTDGIYRELPSKVKKAVEKECIAVDMEASALFTIAKFHKKKIAGFFVPSDYVGTEKWIQLKPSSKKLKPVKLFQLALQILKKVKKEIN